MVADVETCVESDKLSRSAHAPAWTNKLRAPIVSRVALGPEISGAIKRMIDIHEGGRLCGDVRYKTAAEPIRITICHCTFYQRFTGTAFLVEPIFKREDVVLSGGPLRSFDHRSDGSNKRVTLNFCGRCGTALYLDFERFPEVLGLCGGTFGAEQSWG